MKTGSVFSYNYIFQKKCFEIFDIIIIIKKEGAIR